MKISEKAALAMAGYTKAEIEAMEKPQAMQTMTQTLQANALGLGIQQQPTADAATVTARIIDPTYGKEVK